MKKPMDLNHKPLEQQTSKPTKVDYKSGLLHMMTLTLPNLFWFILFWLLWVCPRQHGLAHSTRHLSGRKVFSESIPLVTKTLENMPWMIYPLLTHIWMLSKNPFLWNDNAQHTENLWQRASPQESFLPCRSIALKAITSSATPGEPC